MVQIKLILKIYSQYFEVDILRQFLLNDPHVIWSKEPLLKLENTIQTNGVMLEMEFNEDWNLEWKIEEISGMINVSNLDKFSEKQLISKELGIVIYTDSTNPSFSLNKKQIKLLSDLDIDIDIDIYSTD